MGSKTDTSYDRELFDRLPCKSSSYLKTAASKFRFFELDFNLASGNFESRLEWQRGIEAGLLELASQESTPVCLKDINWFWVNDSRGSASLIPDSKWGLPDDINELKEKIDSGNFLNSILETLSGSIKDSKLDLKVCDPNSKTLVGDEAVKFVCTAFGGPTMGNKTLEEFFEASNLQKVRTSIEVGYTLLHRYLPENFKQQFYRGGFPNWKTLIEKILTWNRPQNRVGATFVPNLQEFRALFNTIGNLKNLTVASQVEGIREEMYKFFSTYKNYRNLADSECETINFSGKESYSPILNWLAICTATRDLSETQFKKVLERFCEGQNNLFTADLTIEKILDEKQKFYQIIDSVRSAKFTFDRANFLQCFDESPDSIVSKYESVFYNNMKGFNRHQKKEPENSQSGANKSFSQVQLEKPVQNHGIPGTPITEMTPEEMTYEFNYLSSQGLKPKRQTKLKQALKLKGFGMNLDRRPSQFQGQTFQGQFSGRIQQNFRPRNPQNFRGSNFRPQNRPQGWQPRSGGQFNSKQQSRPRYNNFNFNNGGQDNFNSQQMQNFQNPQNQFGEQNFENSNQNFQQFTYPVGDQADQQRLQQQQQQQPQTQTDGMWPTYADGEFDNNFQINQVKNDLQFNMFSCNQKTFQETNSRIDNKSTLDFSSVTNLIEDHFNKNSRAPFIMCQIPSRNSQIRVVFDTGADASLLNEDLLKYLPQDSIVWGSPDLVPKKASSCTSAEISLLPRPVSFKLDIGSMKIKIEGAMVFRGPTKFQNQLLLGNPNLLSNNFDYKTIETPGGKRMQIKLQNKILNIFSTYHVFGFNQFLMQNQSIENCKARNKTNKQTSDWTLSDLDHLPVAKILKWPVFSGSHNSASNRQNSGEPINLIEITLNYPEDRSLSDFDSVHAFDPEDKNEITENDTKQVLREVYPDSEATWRRKMEILREDFKNKSTIDDVQYDPDGSFLKANPGQEKFIQEMREIAELDRFSLLWRADVGSVPGDRFQVKGQIHGDLCGRSIKNYYATMNEVVLNAVMKKLDEEISQGVLIDCLENGVVPQNILPILGVGKRNGEGKMILNTQSVRIVVNAATGVNDATVFKGQMTDDIHSIIQKVTPYTERGYMCIADLTQAYYSFCLHPSLYPYFCVEHPKRGLFCYRKLVQGWIASPAFCRQFLNIILYKFEGRVFRYMDDLIIVGNSPEELKQTWFELLNTLAYYDLRLKGKKVQVLGCVHHALGLLLSYGSIQANPHSINNLNDLTFESLGTVYGMRGFSGLAAYLAKFCPHSTELLLPFQALTGGKSQDKVELTDDLKKKFYLVRARMNQLMHLHPILPDKPVYVTVDTSYLATAAEAHQYDDNGNRRFIGFFSKKRLGLNKELPGSCILELQGIAGAVNFFAEKLRDPTQLIMVKTDSRSCAMLYEKLMKTGIPSETNMKINRFFGLMMHQRFSIQYVEAAKLGAIDFLSRYRPMIEKYKNCSDCLVCKAIEDEQQSQFFNRLEAIWSWASANPFESDLQKDLTVNQFLQLNRFEVLGDSEELKAEVQVKNISGSSEVIQGHRLGQFAPDYVWNSFSRKKLNSNKKVEFSSQGLKIANLTVKNCDLTLNDLLKDLNLLTIWQSKEHAISECKKFLKLRSEGKNLLPNPKKQRKATTYIEQKCFVDENGLLRRPKALPSDSGEQPRNLLIVPPLNNTILMKIIHNTFGHNSCAHFEKVAREHFCTTGFSEAVKNYIGQCQGCLAMKNKPKIFKPLKEIEIPDRIGKCVLIDEMHFYKASDRSGPQSQKYRFLFATESLTRFSKLYPVSGDLTVDKLIPILKRIRADFGQRTMDNIDLIIRADQHQVHKSLQTNPRLQELRIKIEIHPKTSLSKNNIPELDGRGNQIARIVRDELTQEGRNRDEIAWAVEKRYNNLRGDTNFTPLELWTGCRQITGQPFKIDLKGLIERLKQCRAAHRAVKDRQASQNRHRLPIQFEPFDSSKTYENNSVSSPLKLGDWVLVDKPFDKNDHNPYFKIVSNSDFPTGIDWAHKLILTQKVGVQKVLKNYVWHMDAISGVLDGSVQQLNSFRFTGRKCEKRVKVPKELRTPKNHLVPKTIEKAESFPFPIDTKLPEQAQIRAREHQEWLEWTKEDFEVFERFLAKQKKECLEALEKVQRPQEIINSIDTIQEESTVNETVTERSKFVPNSYLESTCEPSDQLEIVENSDNFEILENQGLDPNRGSTPVKGATCDFDHKNIIQYRTRSGKACLPEEPEPEPEPEPAPEPEQEADSFWSFW